jgi:hypothetical protein
MRTFVTCCLWNHQSSDCIRASSLEDIRTFRCLCYSLIEYLSVSSCSCWPTERVMSRRCTVYAHAHSLWQTNWSLSSDPDQVQSENSNFVTVVPLWAWNSWSSASTPSICHHIVLGQREDLLFHLYHFFSFYHFIFRIILLIFTKLGMSVIAFRCHSNPVLFNSLKSIIIIWRTHETVR